MCEFIQSYWTGAKLTHVTISLKKIKVVSLIIAVLHYFVWIYYTGLIKFCGLVEKFTKFSPCFISYLIFLVRISKIYTGR